MKKLNSKSKGRILKIRVKKHKLKLVSSSVCGSIFKICDREILGKFVEIPVPESCITGGVGRERSVKCKTVKKKWKRGHAGRERLEGSAKVARLSLSVPLPLTSLCSSPCFFFT